MDAKVTLSFNEAVIIQAKELAASHNISLSRLCEFLLSKAAAAGASYPSLDELPVSSWVSMVAEGQAEYVRKPRTSKAAKAEYRQRK
jgi:hypothetical protein